MNVKIEEELARMEAEVTATEGANASAANLLAQLGALLQANKDVPARIASIADRLMNDNASLAAAVAEFTPVEEPPAEPPV